MRGEKIVSIVEALRSKAFRYALKEGEKLGSVFQVYFYTVSDPVPDFFRKLTVKNAGYVYAVIPCGASIGVAGGFLKSELKKRGLDEEQVSQVLRLPGLLPGLGDPVRKKTASRGRYVNPVLK